MVEKKTKFNGDSRLNNDFECERALGFAVLRKSKTGLPVNLYLDDFGDWIKNGHPKQVLFQCNYNDDIDTSKLAPISLAFFPQILTDDQSLYAEIAECDIRVVLYFVDEFQDLLFKLCIPDNDYTIRKFLKSIHKRNYDYLREQTKLHIIRPWWKFFVDPPKTDDEPYSLSGYKSYWEEHEQYLEDIQWAELEYELYFRKDCRRIKLWKDKICRDKQAKLTAMGKKRRPHKRFQNIRKK